MQATAAILLLLLVGAASQSYMQQPPGRLNNGAAGASQVAPCGEGTNSPSPNWYPGGTYTITWTENQDSDDPVYLNLLKEVTVDTEIRFNTTINGTEVENSTIVSNTSIVFYRNLRTLDYNTNTYSLRLPTDVPAGFYYLQWNWTTYYSCAYINVSADPVGWRILRVNQQQTALVPVQTYHYYEFSIAPNNQNFYEVFGTGPTQANAHITVVGKRGFTPLPSMDNGGNTVMSSTAGEADYSISFCRDTQNVDYSIGVIGAAGADPASSYTINARGYPFLVNANNQLSSGKHNGKKYYVTDSYETEKRRRLVLTAEGDFTTPLSFTLADNCRQTNTLIRGIQIGTTKGCIQLPPSENDKYIEVSSVSTPYTLSVEVGECTEVNAGSIAKFSLLLLAAVLAVFVF